MTYIYREIQGNHHDVRKWLSISANERYSFNCKCRPAVVATILLKVLANQSSSINYKWLPAIGAIIFEAIFGFSFETTLANNLCSPGATNFRTLLHPSTYSVTQTEKPSSGVLEEHLLYWPILGLFNV